MAVRRSIRKVTIEKDVHDQLMLELVKYFSASEIWEVKKWDHKAIEARNALGAIAVLCRTRRKEIRSIQLEVIKTRRELKKQKKGESNE